MAVLSTMFVDNYQETPYMKVDNEIFPHHDSLVKCATSHGLAPSMTADYNSIGYDPTDGPEDEVWYCQDCGDGPYLKWQVSCANCYENKRSAGHQNGLDAILDPWVKLGSNYAPTDGDAEWWWFCSECQDGPYGSWQVSCQANGCGHTRCGSCRVEVKK